MNVTIDRMTSGRRAHSPPYRYSMTASSPAARRTDERSVAEAVPDPQDRETPEARSREATWETEGGAAPSSRSPVSGR